MKPIFSFVLFIVLIALGASVLNLLTSNLGMVLFAAIVIVPFAVSAISMSTPDPSSQDIKNIEKAIQTQSEALSLIVSKLR